jgi:hypothetical protein
VGTSNELQAINMVELGCDFITKQPASATRGNSPSLNILRIAPDKVTEGTLVRDLLSTSNDTNLINGADLRAETTVNAENLTVNNSSEDKKVKDLAAGLPNRSIAVLLLTLLIEAVDLSDLTGLVVASNEGDLVRIPWQC